MPNTRDNENEDYSPAPEFGWKGRSDEYNNGLLFVEIGFRSPARLEPVLTLNLFGLSQLRTDAGLLMFSSSMNFGYPVTFNMDVNWMMMWP